MRESGYLNFKFHQNNFFTDIIPVAMKFAVQYKGLFRLWLGPKLMVVLSTPEHFQTFLTATANSVTKPDNYLGMVELTGRKTIFIANGKFPYKLFLLLILLKFLL